MFEWKFENRNFWIMFVIMILYVSFVNFFRFLRRWFCKSEVWVNNCTYCRWKLLMLVLIQSIHNTACIVKLSMNLAGSIVCEFIFFIHYWCKIDIKTKRKKNIMQIVWKVCHRVIDWRILSECWHNTEHTTHYKMWRR